MKKIVLKILIISLCISAILGIGIVLIGEYNDIAFNILGTTSIIFGFCIPGLCSSSIYDKKEYRAFSIAGMFFSILSAFVLICLLWDLFEFIWDALPMWRFTFTLFTLAISFGHIALLLSMQNADKLVKNVGLFTLASSIAFDILWLVYLWSEFSLGDFCERLLVVLIILVTLGTIVTPILHKMYPMKKQNQNK